MAHYDNVYGSGSGEYLCTPYSCMPPFGTTPVTARNCTTSNPIGSVTESLPEDEELAANICAKRYLCYGNADSDGLESEDLGNVGHVVSGDLKCESGSTQKVFPILQVAEGYDALKTHELLDACLSDLNPELLTFGDDDFGLNGLSTGALTKAFSNHGCVALGRFFRALHFATKQRNDLGLPNKWSSNTEGDRLFLRLVAQWLQVHGFVANELLQQKDYSDLLTAMAPSSPGAQAVESPTPERSSRSCLTG